MTSILTNATLVLRDEVVTGSVRIDGEMIEMIDTAPSRAADAIDFGGDYLIPGLVDLHTDNIEHHFQPRPGVRWPSALAAAMAHDFQMLGSGVTTVLDSTSLGDYDSAGARTAMLDAAIGGVTAARTAGLMKADHYFHFRCELSDPHLMGIFERHIDNPWLRLISTMDHTPGQRQWQNLPLYREFRRKKNNQVWSEEEFASYVAGRREHQARYVASSREAIGRAARERHIPLASHDDSTIAEVDQSHEDGITISEFPTTIVAADRARALGMSVVMGSPNIVLGRSHSGNVSAGELADADLLDVLTSDYVPASLLHAAFILVERGFDLPKAIATVTANPAQLVGFSDRGRIAPGLRADLLRVRLVDKLPVVCSIWVAGRKYL